MQTIYEAKEIADSVANAQNAGKTLNIFDFDGTIYNSPVPNPTLWNSKTIGLLMKSYTEDGLGWFQNTLTLDPKYVEGLGFNDGVVAEVERSMKDPNAITVLLTGRTMAFLSRIKSIVDGRGLSFDEYGLKPTNTSDTTMQFKQRFITDLLGKYPEVTRIEMWDDRSKHVSRFTEFLRTIGFDGEVHLIREPDSHIKNRDSERELVSLLEQDPRAGGKTATTFAGLEKGYYASALTPESHDVLVGEVSDKIPEGWTIQAHHMTMLFKGNRSEEIEEYVSENIGSHVELTATHLGMSPDAMAVKISSKVPSFNATPHITIAIPPNGYAVNSNDISNWVALQHPIKLDAVIRHLLR